MNDSSRHHLRIRFRRVRKALPAVFLLPALAACGGGYDYPETRKEDISEELHGVSIEDPYRWLEDDQAPEVLEWVDAQNEVTFDHLRSLPGREAIRGRLLELQDHARQSAPFRFGEQWFVRANDGLQDQDVLYRIESPGEDPTGWEVLLDPNELSEDGTTSVGMTAFTEDGALLAYGLAEAGSDWREFHVMEVDSGEKLDDHLRWIKYSEASWTHDNGGFFYSRYPEPDPDAAQGGINQNMTVWYHALGTAQDADTLIYARPEFPNRLVGAQVSDDGRYAVFSISEGVDQRNGIHILDLGRAESPSFDGEIVPVLDEFDAYYGFLGNDGPRFYFLTDNDAPRYRVVAINIERPDPANWLEIVPESENTLLTARIVGDRFILDYLDDAKSRLAVHTMDGAFERDVPLPGIGSVGQLSGTRKDDVVHFTFSSFLFPPSVHRYDLASGGTEPHWTPEVPFDFDQYETNQVFFASMDGTQIPMFLTHRKDMMRDGDNPTLLYGYGGFNISLPPSFNPSNLVFLERGGVYVQVNLRGGGEYGESWHRAGMLENKQNVFDDFIAAAEFLIHDSVTQPSRLAIAGGSNGGLLVGAVLNQQPELFGAALPAVGVMDMLRFHKFTIGWAWTSDYGSPDDPEMFEVLRAYSPYHNVAPSEDFPPTLVTTADHDDRVAPGHSFKYAARIQEVHGDGPNPVFIRIQKSAGHGSGMPVSMRVELEADRWAFVLHHLGVDSSS